MPLPWEHMDRQILKRKFAKSNQDYGTRPSERSVEQLLEMGIIDINKPSGPSSHQVSAYVQQILGIKKSGHSGTLDPKVTGVLPVALGRGTRIVQALLTAGKEYVCLMQLHKPAEEKAIQATCAEFVGKIRQLPPVKSAVKRRWRFRKIYYLDILEIKDRFVLFRVGCQAGTYIRKLCTDIGDKLGTGAHMAQLVRTKAGPFDDRHMVTLQDLRDAWHYYRQEGNDTFIKHCIQPIEAGVGHLPKVWVLDNTVDAICHGGDVMVPGISKVHSDIQVDELVAVMTLKEELIGFGKSFKISREMLRDQKGLAIKVEKVFMKPGTYPRKKRKKDENG